MLGKDFLEKIQKVDRHIRILTAAADLQNGGLTALTQGAQEEILEMLQEYKKLLLETEVK